MSRTSEALPHAASAYDLAEQPPPAPPSKLKSAAFSSIRFAHRLLASPARAIDGRTSIYFHELPPDRWDAFRICIEHFKARGYSTVSPSGFLAAAHTDRCLFVSFDDNFRDWHAALPMLASLGITATFYVNSLPFRDIADDGTIARYSRRLGLPRTCETLSRDELRQIKAHGHTIGCHSHSHFILARLPPDLWETEIGLSKKILEDIIGDEVTDFAWPYGMRRHFSEELRQYCASIGFKTITNAMSGCQKIAADNPLDIYRTDWRLDASLQTNLANLRIDGRLYAHYTGRSVIGS